MGEWTSGLQAQDLTGPNLAFADTVKLALWADVRCKALAMRAPQKEHQVQWGRFQILVYWDD